MNREIPPSVRKIHLIAICGTGVGSLAGLLKLAGYEITGSDQNTYPPMSTEMESMGIKLFTGYSPENIHQANPDLVIVGNAVSKTNVEVQEVLAKNIPFISMPEALSHFFISSRESIVVSGTHGKTTTTALLGHLLLNLKSDPSYLVGGILQEGEKNYRLGKGPYFAIEGDEYDTAFFDKGPKFLHYQPYYTIVTSLEFDHADIYRDLDHLSQSFEALLKKNNPKGFILACTHYPQLMKILKLSAAPVETYGLQGQGDWNAGNIRFQGALTHFDIEYRGKKECELRSPLLGEHNILNTLACYAVLRRLGFEPKNIQEALLTFKGVKRRQEVRGTVNDIIVMDDFAHHPTAVLETIDAVKKRYPQHQLWAVFEPRSNSSKRNVFQKDYTNAFKSADHVILADVFMPEKVTDGQVLDVDQIVSELQGQGIDAHHISGVEAIVSHVTSQARPSSVVLIMSNGGFGGIHEKLLKSLRQGS